MPFPSRGCHTCKSRRVKCDEVRPVCRRCQKGNLECQPSVDDGPFIFLDENPYVKGHRHRPRGPHHSNAKSNVITALGQRHPPEAQSHPKNTSALSHQQSSAQTWQDPSASSSKPLSIPLDQQALAYFARFHAEAPSNCPEIADGHMHHAFAGWPKSQAGSILNLTILALSHATFGRARASSAALVKGASFYSKALSKTNIALRSNQIPDNEILLAVMLLSFYENAVARRSSELARAEGIQVVASQSFAHHDGAMAILQTRCRNLSRTSAYSQLDRLIRRQLLRSLILRGAAVPYWLRNGQAYGETGLALELDRCMVRVATLKNKANMPQAIMSAVEMPSSNLLYLIQEAIDLDRALKKWADTLSVQDSSLAYDQGSKSITICPSHIPRTGVHTYSSPGHAGIWNRYRALRLTTNHLLLKCLAKAESIRSLPSTRDAYRNDAKERIEYLADDLAASIPYSLGLTHAQQKKFHIDTTMSIGRVGQDLRFPEVSIKATAASFLCWPLSMVSFISSVSPMHRQYFKQTLRVASMVVDDGVLEQVADNFDRAS